MNKTWEIVSFILLLGLFAFVGAMVGGSIVTYRFQEDFKADTVFFYEGDAGWISVHSIKIENDILEKKLNDTQAHYDSMKCTAW